MIMRIDIRIENIDKAICHDISEITKLGHKEMPQDIIKTPATS